MKTLILSLFLMTACSSIPRNDYECHIANNYEVYAKLNISAPSKEHALASTQQAIDNLIKSGTIPDNSEAICFSKED